MNRKRRWLRYLPAAVVVVLILVVAAVVYQLRELFQKPVQAKKQVQQVTILAPPPPPPPPPDQPPPPPPEVKEEEKIEEPEPEPEPEQEQAEEAPPGDDLGVDAEGGAGSDAFGLMGKKGGRGLIGGGGGSAVVWYGQQVGRALEDELQSLLEDTPARKSNYTATVNVWIGADGRVNRAELAGGTGKPEVDQALRQAVSRLKLSLQKAPPENMPQPLKVRITSRI